MNATESRSFPKIAATLPESLHSTNWPHRRIMEDGDEKKLNKATALLSSPAAAQDNAVKEPLCQRTGRASKGDLVHSMECRNNPQLGSRDERLQSSPSDYSENFPDQVRSSTGKQIKPLLDRDGCRCSDRGRGARNSRAPRWSVRSIHRRGKKLRNDGAGSSKRYCKTDNIVLRWQFSREKGLRVSSITSGRTAIHRRVSINSASHRRNHCSGRAMATQFYMPDVMCIKRSILAYQQHLGEQFGIAFFVKIQQEGHMRGSNFP